MPTKRPAGAALMGLYVVWILILTLTPLPSPAASLPRWFDKLVHFGLFLPLPTLLAFGVLRSRWGGVALPIALAGAIELVQAALPFRTGEVWDFVWGVGGTVVGAMIAPAALSLSHRVTRSR